MVRTQIMQSFVARIWLERAQDQDPTWRGHVQHIQGSEEAYFHDLAELHEFLERISGMQGPDSRSGAQHGTRRPAARAQTKKKDE